MACDLGFNLTLRALISVSWYWEGTGTDDKLEWFFVFLDAVYTVPSSNVALLLDLITKINNNITISQEWHVALVNFIVTLSQFVDERVLIGKQGHYLDVNCANYELIRVFSILLILPEIIHEFPDFLKFFLD